MCMHHLLDLQRPYCSAMKRSSSCSIPVQGMHYKKWQPRNCEPSDFTSKLMALIDGASDGIEIGAFTKNFGCGLRRRLVHLNHRKCKAVKANKGSIHSGITKIG